jgi:hypothetical protein
MGRLYGGSSRPQHGVANIKLLVTNDETEFKILNFWTYFKIVKLTDSQLGTMRRIHS